MTPWLSPAEIACIRRYLTPSSVVLEYGTGGSTVEFAPLVAAWRAVEHNSKWFERVALLVRPHVPSCELCLAPPDIESPRRPSRAADWRTYVEAHRHWAEVWDFVLIDGRARPECADEVLPFLAPGAVVAVHDWFDPLRPHYQRILERYQIVEEVPIVDRKHGAGMVVLRPRSQA